ncbi:unnamed protein product [Ixodes persulcatus]
MTANQHFNKLRVGNVLIIMVLAVLLQYVAGAPAVQGREDGDLASYIKQMVDQCIQALMNMMKAITGKGSM